MVRLIRHATTVVGGWLVLVVQAIEASSWWTAVTAEPSAMSVSPWWPGVGLERQDHWSREDLLEMREYLFGGEVIVGRTMWEPEPGRSRDDPSERLADGIGHC